MSTFNGPITFSVVGGPGFLFATANGNPADHVAIHSTTREAYHGMARAVVRASVDSSGTHGDRIMRKFVNVDAGRGGQSATIVTGVEDASVMVRACASRLGCGQIVIATSSDTADSPLEIAAKSVGLADISG